ncbi:uncharacterized protein L3040_009102 [Drepanopeziza brunnea f. sp. 'multigermtubi']|uniref:Uncharacterized protein n=1 Tax=Marssonina brunnea f. sp. multigermtubi (strain MB_m1) TaxID=1072389 RepID=K1WDT2_MARBU|nr:uncharacterized protein MBM_06198 [Drepanopeziza brunnea f. sp. 'multigermtubi' MB_m1]EKD15570.1 hypothetical protein MBM_06198 [Drepanopeziza brunnea f. sp. 'multigermtubi' MB_m1]KAJ5032500.1 hypothetical protein L3040_009102 [Drepanopeziza brunnea f. sp. 'multigermtubi']
MPFSDVDYEDLVGTLTDNFNVLADEVQLLSDRKQILEHKLRFAHEQYQHLADKYAPGDPETSNVLAKLQPPTDLQISASDRTGVVPLPQRTQRSSKHQTAVAIRDGRRAAQRLAGTAGKSSRSTHSGKSLSGTSSNVKYSARRTSLSTVLEQDFTVAGKKSSLLCPFSRTAKDIDAAMDPQRSQRSGTHESDLPLNPSDARDPTRHQSADPICAALYAETMNSPPPSATGSGAKCPIRYMDQHSPEEIAQYFESHKHEIPRSHEVCVKRYQRNEDDIRKLDAKYGSLVSMIQGLGQKHQPMLPTKEEEEAMELERTSNERVENWAHAVSADGVEPDEHEPGPDHEEERESRFDRPLKEVRVGESPSRPWGISVPLFEPDGGQRPVSPPPAPVSAQQHMPQSAGCPFGHGPKVQMEKPPASPPSQERPAGDCPFGHGAGPEEKPAPNSRPLEERPIGKCPFPQAAAQKSREEPQPAPVYHNQPTFIQPYPEMQKHGVLPQMVFTGPVFIGYPMEQAITFMQQYRETQ